MNPFNDHREIITVQEAFERRLWAHPGAVLSCPRWERYLRGGNEQRKRECAATGEAYKPQINPFADYDVVDIRPVLRGRDKGRYEVTFTKNAGMAEICMGKEPFVKLLHDGGWPLRYTDAREWLPSSWYTVARS